MDRAAFFFCRDTISRDYLKSQGVKTPILEFGPDAQLGMHLRDDPTALAYMKANQLAEGKFICVIPRKRYTPYSQMNGDATRPRRRRHLRMRSTTAPPKRTSPNYAS